jgi:hypothetical protein
MARVAGGAFGFLIFNHAVVGPHLYDALSFLSRAMSLAGSRFFNLGVDHFF